MKRQITSLAKTALLIGLGALLQGNQHACAAGKPKEERGFFELLVSGAILSVPDHTSNAGEIAPPYRYDLCRNEPVTGLSFRKVTLYLPFNFTCPDAYPGPGFYTQQLIFGFASNPATTGSAVTVQRQIARNYVLQTVGTISSGQWPLPAADNLLTPVNETKLQIKIPAGAKWEFISYGKGCSTSFSNLGEVTIDVTRNDADHTADVCDCPETYTDTNGNLIADECE